MRGTRRTYCLRYVICCVCMLRFIIRTVVTTASCKILFEKKLRPRATSLSFDVSLPALARPSIFRDVSLPPPMSRILCADVQLFLCTCAATRIHARLLLIDRFVRSLSLRLAFFFVVFRRASGGRQGRAVRHGKAIAIH